MAEKTNKELYAKLLMLYTQKHDRMVAECEEDPSVQDDTEWVNEYHQIVGVCAGLRMVEAFIRD